MIAALDDRIMQPGVQARHLNLKTSRNAVFCLPALGVPRTRGLYKPFPGPRAKSNFFGGFMKLRFIMSWLALVTVFGLGTQAQELPKIDASVSYSSLRATPGTSGVGVFYLNGGCGSAA